MSNQSKKISVLAEEIVDKHFWNIDETIPSHMFSDPSSEEEDNGPDTIPESSPSSKVPPTLPSATDIPTNLFSLVAKNADLAKKITHKGGKLYEALTLFEEEAPTLTKEKLVHLHRKLSAILAAIQSIEL